MMFRRMTLSTMAPTKTLSRIVFNKMTYSRMAFIRSTVSRMAFNILTVSRMVFIRSTVS